MKLKDCVNLIFVEDNKILLSEYKLLFILKLFFNTQKISNIMDIIFKKDNLVYKFRCKNLMKPDSPKLLCLSIKRCNNSFLITGSEEDIKTLNNIYKEYFILTYDLKTLYTLKHKISSVSEDNLDCDLYFCEKVLKDIIFNSDDEVTPYNGAFWFTLKFEHPDKDKFIALEGMYVENRNSIQVISYVKNK